MRNLLLGLSLACASYFGVLVYANATKPEDLTGVVYVKNYDGDTLTVDIPGLPPIFGHHLPVRLLGLDTPEIKGRCEWEKGMAIVAQTIVAWKANQAHSIILRHVKRDLHFRVDATVLFDGESLNQYLLDSGLARPYDGKARQGWCS